MKNRKYTTEYPRCHGWIGTPKDNILDAATKGRMDFSGEKNPAAKITASDVKEIRRLYKTDMSQTDIARKFGLTQSYISQILRGDRWKQLN